MKTEQLVSLLATRVEAVDRTLIARRCGWALGAGILVALALTLGALHLNPTLSRYLHLPMFWAREVYCIALAVAGFFAVARLARPGVRLGWVRLGIIVPVLAMWVLAGIALLATPPEAHMRMILGGSAAKCPFLIALIGVPVLHRIPVDFAQFCPDPFALGGCCRGLRRRLPRRLCVFPALSRTRGTVYWYLVPARNADPDDNRCITRPPTLALVAGKKRGATVTFYSRASELAEGRGKTTVRSCSR